MKSYEKHDIEIDKTDEPRKKGISKMIDEGGLGADKYYDIKKEPPHDDKDGKPPKVFKDDDDEGNA